MSKVSKQADVSGAGLLQIEYGYDGDFHEPGTAADQTATASLLFNVSENLQVEFDFDTVHALTFDSRQTAASIGDAYAGAQFTALAEAPRRPSLGMSYLAKLPTADAARGLGTGRIDHKVGLLASKNVAAMDLDFNASLLINGKPEAHGWQTGGQVALGVSRTLAPSLSVQGELFGETLDTDRPRGVFVQGGFTYHPTNRASIDVGVRTGLSANTPRIGFVAGVSFAVATPHGTGAPGGAHRSP